MAGGRCGTGKRTRSLSARVSGAIARRALATAGVGAGVEADSWSGERGWAKGSAGEASEPGKRE